MIKTKPETKKSKPEKIAPSPAASSPQPSTGPVKYSPLTISVDDALLAQVDKEWHAKGHRSRSETARALLVRGLAK